MQELSPTSLPESNPATSEFKLLSKEELSQMTPYEKAMYSFERDISKLQKDIEDSEREISILYDMNIAAEKGDLTDETKHQFIAKLNDLKRFQGSGSEKFVDTLMQRHKQGEQVFGEQINVNHGYIDEYRKALQEEEKNKQEYLNDRFTV